MVLTILRSTIIIMLEEGIIPTHNATPIGHLSCVYLSVRPSVVRPSVRRPSVRPSVRRPPVRPSVRRPSVRPSSVRPAGRRSVVLDYAKPRAQNNVSVMQPINDMASLQQIILHRILITKSLRYCYSLDKSASLSSCCDVVHSEWEENRREA